MEDTGAFQAGLAGHACEIRTRRSRKQRSPPIRLAEQNFRGRGGNVGIIRYLVRATALSNSPIIKEGVHARRCLSGESLDHEEGT